MDEKIGASEGWGLDDGHAVTDHDHLTSDQRPRMGGCDILTLLVGLAALLVSGYVLSDGSTWFSGLDLRWVVAGGAVIVGIFLFAASLRGGRKKRSD